MRLRWAFALLLAAAALSGCNRKKAPFATRVWLGPATGCVETKEHPTIGTLACWGANDAGQIGDGSKDARLAATAFRLKTESGNGSGNGNATLTDLALGARHACAVVDRHAVYCWGDGSRGQLGERSAGSLSPVLVESDPSRDLHVAVGREHTCVWGGQRVRCFGSNAEGQVGSASPSGVADPWNRGADVRAVALGDAHTCVAYAAAGERPASVECRGRASAAPASPLLGAKVVTALAAGGEHTCALFEDRAVQCWGRNDAGQLGDGTTNDATTPVAVVDLHHALQITAGTRHTCARFASNLVSCWGDNRRHQLSNGTTEKSSRPVSLHGLLGVIEVAAAGDSGCALLGDGYVRCWGANDQGQLADLSTVEHDVPMPLKFR